MKKNGLQDVIERSITLTGIRPLMLDPYAGDNKTQLQPEQKMYFLPDGKSLCIPAKNLTSFLSATNSNSAAKSFGGKQYAALANALRCFVAISPARIPLTREGKPIVFHGFTNDRDDEDGIYVDRDVARLAKGVPNPKVRPVVELPWELGFTLQIFKNDVFDEVLLKSLVERGGLSIGMGTFRGTYGKFLIERWK